MWLSGLNVGLQTKGSLVRFPVRAHAWVAGQVPSMGCARGNHTWMFLSLSSPTSRLSLKIKKRIVFFLTEPHQRPCLPSPTSLGPHILHRFTGLPRSFLPGHSVFYMKLQMYFHFSQLPPRAPSLLPPYSALPQSQTRSVCGPTEAAWCLAGRTNTSVLTRGVACCPETHPMLYCVSITSNNQPIISFLYRFYLFILRERGREGGRKRGRETSMCSCLSRSPYW